MAALQISNNIYPYIGRSRGPFLDSNGDVWWISSGTPVYWELTRVIGPGQTTYTVHVTIGVTDLNLSPVDAQQDGDTLHIVWGRYQTGTNAYDYFYRTYDLSTQAWIMGAAETIHIGASNAAPLHKSVHVAVRPNGEVNVLHQGTQVANMGTKYARVAYSYRTGVDTWVTVDPAWSPTDAAFNDLPRMCVANPTLNMIYIGRTDSTGTSFPMMYSVTTSHALVSPVTGATVLDWEFRLLKPVVRWGAGSGSGGLYQPNESTNLYVQNCPMNAGGGITGFETNGQSLGITVSITADLSISVNPADNRMGITVYNGATDIFHVQENTTADTWGSKIDLDVTSIFDPYTPGTFYTMGGYYTRAGTETLGILFPSTNSTSNAKSAHTEYTFTVPLDVSLSGALTRGAGVISSTINISGGASATVQAIALVTASANVEYAVTTTVQAIALVSADGSQWGTKFGDATVVAIGHVVPPVATATLGVVDMRMTAYRWRKHLGEEAQHQYMQPIDTDIDAIEGVDYALRVLVENQGAKDATIQGFALEYRKNAGSWTPISVTSTDIQCNQDPTRFITSPEHAGDVYSHLWKSNGVHIEETGDGTLHRFIRDMTPGVCLSSNPRYMRYQRSINQGVSWIDNVRMIGGQEPASQYCVSGYLGRMMSNASGSEITLWMTDLPFEDGDYGTTVHSTDYGATWVNWRAFNADASHRLRPNNGGTFRAENQGRDMVMQEDGTLYFFVVGEGTLDYVTPPPDDEGIWVICQYKSIDGGVSWTYSEIVFEEVTGGPQVTYKPWNLYSAQCNQTTGDLFVFWVDDLDLKCLKSTDDGANWSVASTIHTLGTDDVWAWMPNGGADNGVYFGTYVNSMITVDGVLTVYTCEDPPAVTGYYILMHTSVDDGVTWSSDYLLRSPSQGDPVLAESRYLQMGSGRVSSEHSSARWCSPSYLTSFYDGTYTGPQYLHNESGGFWTGPHNTRIERESTYYEDIKNAGGTTASNGVMTIDRYGNVHILFQQTVASNFAGSKAFYDAEPPYTNLRHSPLNILGGQAGVSFDATNHCYTVDTGTVSMGPARLRALTKVEFDIKLRTVAADVVTTDVLDFRINGINNDVVPSLTIAANEKVWPGTTGTTITAGVNVIGQAVTTATATPEYKNAVSPSLPALINANAKFVPKGRKTGPYFNYENDKYYVLTYKTGPTGLQFYTTTTNRDGPWSTVGSAISAGATDSVWAEQGKHGYEHMIYVAVQYDSTGGVDFYELDTSTGTLSSAVSLSTPANVPLVACVSIAVRKNGSSADIVVAYNSQRDGTYSTERCSVRIRTCSGGSWGAAILIDGSDGAALNHWQNPTLVEGSGGLVHCFTCNGPLSVNSYVDAIWCRTLRLDGTKSIIVGIPGITNTASGLNSDLEPPGQAVAFFREEDATEVRIAFKWQNAPEMDCLSLYEAADGDIDFRSPNIIQISLNDANFGATEDTANMVMLADDKDLDPNKNHYALWIPPNERPQWAWDEQPYLFPGYSRAGLRGAPATTRVLKISGNFIYPGGGGVYLGFIYEEPTGLWYDEQVMIPSVLGGPVIHTATSTAAGVATVSPAEATKGQSIGATTQAIADVSIADGSVELYDPNILAAATVTGVAVVTASSVCDREGSTTVVAEAVIGAAGGHLFTGAVTAYAIATVHASPTIFFEAAPVETPINVLVYRGDRGVEESVQNPLITSTLVAIEHGRNIIDEHGLHVKEMNVTVLYNSGYKSGQVIHVEDALRGVTLVGKITGVSHDVRGNESLHITALDIRVPVPEGYYV